MNQFNSISKVVNVFEVDSMDIENLQNLTENPHILAICGPPEGAGDVVFDQDTNPIQCDQMMHSEFASAI